MLESIRKWRERQRREWDEGMGEDSDDSLPWWKSCMVAIIGYGILLAGLAGLLALVWYL